MTKNGFNSLNLGYFFNCSRFVCVFLAERETLSKRRKYVRFCEYSGLVVEPKKSKKIEFTLENLSKFELLLSQPRNLCFFGRS